MSTSPEQYREAQDRQHEQNLEERGHQANLMTDEIRNARAELIDKLMETDLDSGTISALDNLVSPDFILSNMSNQDLTQFRWQLEIKMLQLFSMHPPQGGVSGKARAYYYDDPKDALVPLRPQDRAQLRSFKDGIMSRVLRSKDGYQQDKLGETTSRVETISRDDDGDDTGRIRGFLGR